MRGKLILVAGLATGYVLGARAGRGRYDQIAEAAGKFWQSPAVQKQVSSVEGFAKDKAPQVADFVSGSAKKVVGKKPSSSDSSSSVGDASTTPSI